MDTKGKIYEYFHRHLKWESNRLFLKEELVGEKLFDNAALAISDSLLRFLQKYFSVEEKNFLPLMRQWVRAKTKIPFVSIEGRWRFRRFDEKRTGINYYDEIMGINHHKMNRAQYFNQRETCKRFRISRNTFHMLVNRYKNTPHRNPRQ